MDVSTRGRADRVVDSGGNLAMSADGDVDCVPRIGANTFVADRTSVDAIDLRDVFNTGRSDEAADAGNIYRAGGEGEVRAEDIVEGDAVGRIEGVAGEAAVDTIGEDVGE